MARQKNNISAKFADSLEIHENLKQHAWFILEDKVKLTLIEYEKQFEQAVDWKAPLSVLITIIAAIATTKFEDFFFVPAPTMRALFYFGAIFFLWQTVTKAINARKQKKVKIEEVIQKLRESSEQQETDNVSEVNSNVN